MSMTQEQLRTEWIARLRSGKYQQTRSCLHIPGEGHCCLGVACEILVEEGRMTRGPDLELSKPQAMFDGSSTLLSPEAVTAFGLRDGAGSCAIGERSSLTSLNDYGRTFDEIADDLETGDYWK